VNLANAAGSAHPRARVERRGATRFPGACLRLLVILGIALTAGPSRDCRRDSGGAEDPRRDEPLGSGAVTRQWPSDLRERLAAKFLLASDRPFDVDDADAAEIAECMATRLATALPGGPREAARWGSARTEALVARNATECGREFGERVIASGTWDPRFARVYAWTCANELGARAKPHCACLAAQAPRYFASPAAFVRCASTAKDQLPPRDRARMGRVLNACRRLSLQE
jgi:hypothetical protein